MTATVAKLRKAQLKAELAVLEAEEQHKKTLAAELIEAETAANEARRLAQINKQQLADAVSSLESLGNEEKLIPPGMSGLRTKLDSRRQEAQQEIHRLTVERDKLACELSKKEFAFGKIVEQISENPAYKAVREKQRHLVAEATKVASSLFTVPLDDLRSVLNRIATLADAERKLLNNALGALRAEGLPDLKPLLARFVQQVTPHAILEALPGARTQVFEAITQINELASRRVVL
jgi:chromosome segregation ATPase